MKSIKRQQFAPCRRPDRVGQRLLRTQTALRPCEFWVPGRLLRLDNRGRNAHVRSSDYGASGPPTLERGLAFAMRGIAVVLIESAGLPPVLRVVGAPVCTREDWVEAGPAPLRPRLRGAGTAQPRNSCPCRGRAAPGTCRGASDPREPPLTQTLDPHWLRSSRGISGNNVNAHGHSEAQ